MNEEKVLRVEQKNGWVELVINRPERRNAIIPAISVAMKTALADAENDPTVHSVVLRGEDGYFCSGADLKALQAEPPPPWRDQMGETWRGLHLALYGFRKPVIGALEKYAINAGAALALACDLLVVGESAFMQVGEVQQGVGMPMNAAWFSVKTTEQVIARMSLLGDRVPGHKLVELNIATECVADDAVVNRCRELAERLAGFPEGATQRIKEAIIEQRKITDPEKHFPIAKGPSLLNAGKVS